jgi:hypothetical protein
LPRTLPLSTHKQPFQRSHRAGRSVRSRNTSFVPCALLRTQRTSAHLSKHLRQDRISL